MPLNKETSTGFEKKKETVLKMEHYGSFMGKEL